MRNWRHGVLVAMVTIGCSNAPDPVRSSTNGEPRDGVDSGTAPVKPPRTCKEIGGAQFSYDADGDGVPGIWRDCDGTEQGRWGEIEMAGIDCDDTNDSIWAGVYMDRDGDGYVVGEMQCLDTVPPGYTTRAYLTDCNDADPGAWTEYWADHDGDGFGTSKEVVCGGRTLPDGKPPPGLGFTYSEDCDDTNATIHVGATDAWGDGVDSDCNGDDSSLQCATSPVECGCASLAHKKDVLADGCTGVDLHVVSHEVCQGCLGYNVFMIGNQGTLPLTGGFDVIVSNGNRFHVDGAIAPGRVSDPVKVQARSGFEMGQAVTVRIEAEGTECDTTNNEAELEYAGRAPGMDCGI